MGNRRNGRRNEGVEIEEESIIQSPIEEVRNTVPTTDDPTLPTMTFRIWILGPIACAILTFIDQISMYRQMVFVIPRTCVQIVLVAIANLMAATLPSRPFKIPGIKRSFSMNPGPFNIKENVLLYILSAASPPSSVGIVVVRQIYYKRPLNIWVSILFVFTTQMLGYGFSGIFMRLLAHNPYMWYPFTLLNVSFFRALHDKEGRRKGTLSKFQLLTILTIASYAYQVIPSYFFPTISTLSVVCWIWKTSVIAQLIGSARHGLGIGSFALDWSAVSSYTGSPLVYPFSTLINIAIGFILMVYIVCPIAYWTNSYNAKKFPFLSYDIFDKNGQIYNISKIINEDDLTFNLEGYYNYSIVYKSIVSVFQHAFTFAASSATLSYFVMFHGRELWQQVKEGYYGKKSTNEDIHNKLMKNYTPVPQWWFLTVLVVSFTLAIYACEGFGKELQLPYWGVIIACVLVMIFTLPLGFIAATTGQTISVVGTLANMLMGYFYPGRPIAYLVFETFCSSTQNQALSFLSDFKLGHYMRIPPKQMFIAELTSSAITCLVSLATSWWLMSVVDNMCDAKHLPKGSPWTCPGINVVSNDSVTWGLVGPRRVFFPDGIYSNLFYFFLIGLMAPVCVWVLMKIFPRQKWIKEVNMPIIFGAATDLVLSGPINYWCFLSVGFFFNLIVYRKYKDWWSQNNYVVANGLDLGVAFQTALTSIIQAATGVYGINWWGLEVGDHCPLAQCPTDPSIRVEGCPVL